MTTATASRAVPATVRVVLFALDGTVTVPAVADTLATRQPWRGERAGAPRPWLMIDTRRVTLHDRVSSRWGPSIQDEVPPGSRRIFSSAPCRPPSETAWLSASIPLLPPLLRLMLQRRVGTQIRVAGVGDGPWRAVARCDAALPPPSRVAAGAH